MDVYAQILSVRAHHCVFAREPACQCREGALSGRQGLGFVRVAHARKVGVVGRVRLALLVRPCAVRDLDASRAGKPATRSSSCTDGCEPPSKKPKQPHARDGKFTSVEGALKTTLAQTIDLGLQLKQALSDLEVAKAGLEAYERLSGRQVASLERKVGVAQTKAARAESKAAGDVASTAAAKDRELDRLQAQLDGALTNIVKNVRIANGSSRQTQHDPMVRICRLAKDDDTVFNQEEADNVPKGAGHGVCVQRGVANVPKGAGHERVAAQCRLVKGDYSDPWVLIDSGASVSIEPMPDSWKNGRKIPKEAEKVTVLLGVGSVDGFKMKDTVYTWPKAGVSEPLIPWGKWSMANDLKADLNPTSKDPPRGARPYGTEVSNPLDKWLPAHQAVPAEGAGVGSHARGDPGAAEVATIRHRGHSEAPQEDRE